MGFEVLNLDYEIDQDRQMETSDQLSDGSINVTLPACGIIEIRLFGEDGGSKNVEYWFEGEAVLKIVSYKGFSFLFPRAEIQFPFSQEITEQTGLRSGHFIDENLPVKNNVMEWMADNTDVN